MTRARKRPAVTVTVTPRRDIPEAWESANPVLEPGEIGLELLDGAFSMKLGDGSAPWLDLPYLATGVPLTRGLPVVIRRGQ